MFDDVNPEVGDIVFRSRTDRRFFRVAAVWLANHGYVGYAGITDEAGRQFTVTHWPDGDKILADAPELAILGPEGRRAKLRAALFGGPKRRAWVPCRINRLIYASDGSWTGEIEMSRYERRIRGLP